MTTYNFVRAAARVCRFILLLLTAVAALSAVRAASAGETADVRFMFEPTGQVYAAGDEAAVTMTVVDPAGETARGGMLYVRVTNDGGETLEWHEFNLAEANPTTFRTTLSFPGHMLIKVTASGEKLGGDVHRSAGLLFSPEGIEPGLGKPDDFDAFWDAGKAEAREVPLDERVTPIAELSDSEIEVFEVSFATVDEKRVYGFLSKPVGEGPFPGIVTVPGAGSGTGPDLELPREGFAVLAMNVFPYPVPIDPVERQKVHDEFNTALGVRYCYVGAESRETYFFRAMYLGIDRAIDWFAEQSFVDRNRIGFIGTSQGGASALILTAMNRNIKAAVASVPALCDHAGFLKGRAPGWPFLYSSCGNNPDVLEASRYMDSVNFARKIDSPIRVTTGLIDETCSPASVFAAYNAIPAADKEILIEPRLAHANGVKYEEASAWLLDFVKNKCKKP